MKAGLLIKLAMSNPNPAAICGTHSNIKIATTDWLISVSFNGICIILCKKRRANRETQLVFTYWAGCFFMLLLCNLKVGFVGVILRV